MEIHQNLQLKILVRFGANAAGRAYYEFDWFDVNFGGSSPSSLPCHACLVSQRDY